MLKWTFFYNQLNRGWSEVWYQFGTTLPTGDLLPGNVQAVARASANVRAANVDLTAVRVTKLEAPVQSFLYQTSGSYTPRPVSGSDLEPEVVSTDGLWYLWGIQNAKRPIFLRGLRESEVRRTNIGYDRLVSALSKGVDLYFDAAQKAGFGIRFVNRPPENGLHWWKIGVLAADDILAGISKITLTQLPGLEIIAGTPIRFRGIPKGELVGFPRNTHCIDKPSASVLQIPYRSRGTGLNPSKLYVTALTYDLTLLRTWEFYRFSERKTGRPFGSLRGKSSTVAHAQ